MDDGRTELEEIRARLDRVDEQLVDVLAARSRLIDEIVRHKREHELGVVDRAREDAMLARAEDLARSRGLDPRIARRVLRAVIDAFTLLEVEQLGEEGRPR
jgi:isochorismate pyruvate lyase